MNYAVRLYTADWAAFIAVYEPAGVLIGLLYTLIYQTAGIAYLRRYGRLTPSKLIASYYLGMITPSLIISSVLIAATIGLFYAGFKYYLGFNIPLSAVLPKDWALGIAEVIGLSILASLFMQAVLFLLSVGALNLSLKQIARIAFIPYILAFISYFVYLYINLPGWAILINPFMGLMGAIATVYSGFNYIPSYLAVGSNMEISKAVPLTYGIASVIIWTILLTAFVIPLITRIRYKPPEEIREL